MDNLELYNKYAEVPKEAQKEIKAGRLKGMTDINPMWRIKCLTEEFGVCGIGWYPKIVDKRIEEGANGVMVATVEIELYIKRDNEWLQPISGIGGATFVAKESSGLYTSDEAYKMAYTDALSVCCKMLGIGANVYWSAGRSKYSAQSETQTKIFCKSCGKVINGYKTNKGSISAEEYAKMCRDKLGEVYCKECAKVIKQAPSTPDPDVDGLIPPPESKEAS